MYSVCLILYFFDSFDGPNFQLTQLHSLTLPDSLPLFVLLPVCLSPDLFFFNTTHSLIFVGWFVSDFLVGFGFFPRVFLALSRFGGV